MLYRFSVENFLSFRERSEISFIPCSNEGDRHVIDKDTTIPVLSSAIIYGANAAGKSNFVKAIDYLTKVVVDNRELIKTQNLSYRLDKDSIDRPTVFSIEMKIENKVYQYGLAISFKYAMVLGEWLNEISNGDIQIFNRQYDEKESSVTYNKMLAKSEVNRAKYDVYVDDLKENRTKLFLTEFAQKKYQEDDDLKDAIQKVYQWIDRLIVVFPTSKYNLLAGVVQNYEGVNDLYKSFFEKVGIPIKNIHIDRLKLFPSDVPEDVKSNVKEALMQNEDNKYVVMHDIENNRDVLVELDENNVLVASEIRYTHEKAGYNVNFTNVEESDGTKRLFDLIPLVSDNVTGDRVVIIDEIDRSLHSKLTKSIFKLFFNRQGNVHSQLICTTHDVSLMVKELFRKDEVWFVKNENQESVMYSLNQFDIPSEIMNYSANYMLGRYDALPIIKD